MLLAAGLLLAGLTPLTGASAATEDAGQASRVAAAATSAAPIHTPAPAPGSLVFATATPVGAWVAPGAAIRSAVLLVDDVPVLTTTTATDPALGTHVSAEVDLSPGDHVARLRVEREDASSDERTWAFTATDHTVGRLAGATRIETAVEVSRATFPVDRSATTVTLARADDFADALAAAPLAVQYGGPLLLAYPDDLPAATIDELQRVLPVGSNVNLVGGPAALGTDLEDRLHDLGYPAQRIGGDDRFWTAAMVAEVTDTGDHAFVVNGYRFADALAASTVAARDGNWILLTDRDRLPEATRGMIDGVDRITIVGGEAAVGAQVEEALQRPGRTVRRIAGDDRYATAAAVREAFFPADPDGIGIASGADYPDALTGALHAAAGGHPLLLTPPDRLAAATDAVVRADAPRSMSVYGGTAAISDHTARSAVVAAANGHGAPRLAGATPAPGSVRPFLDDVAVVFDPTPASVAAYAEVDGVEVVSTLTASGEAAVVALPTFEPEVEARHDVRLVLMATAAGGAVGHAEVRFTVLVPDPLFATTGGVEVFLPSREVELIGFHQSNHDGAQQLDARETATRMLTMDSRYRGTGLRSAADIVASPDEPVLSPVTGTVLRAGSYVLYCDHTDHYLVIAPDAQPSWEVKLLHFHDLAVTRGDRVVGGQTRVGSAPRTLPFTSQVDRYSSERDWPHVHVEVVDPNVPDRPGRGC